MYIWYLQKEEQMIQCLPGIWGPLMWPTRRPSSTHELNCCSSPFLGYHLKSNMATQGQNTDYLMWYVHTIGESFSIDVMVLQSLKH